MDVDEAKLAEIWVDDLFERKDEAPFVIGYIESLATRPSTGESKAFTIAIDAQYGEGKSYFVKCLSEQLKLNHPVAFVDAWADDLADEPLTALAATLKKALEPFVTQPEVAKSLSRFMSKTGKVVKIASMGAVKRAASAALTAGAVESISGILDGTSESFSEAAAEVGSETADGLLDDVTEGVKSVTAHDLMEKRVADFEEGQAAIREMKESLAAIVSALEKFDKHPPIVIVIDELDRCRPTYAIKLLEEIKHLFDVGGVVFILALHTDQLAHSVSGAYGSAFDGKAYLRRFVDRQYSLTTPGLRPLIAKLCDDRSLEIHRLIFPITGCPDERIQISYSPSEYIAEYMRIYGLSARDAHQVVDILETSLALTNGQNLYGAYLLPLLIGHIEGCARGTSPKMKRDGKIRFSRRGRNEVALLTVEEAFIDFRDASKLNTAQIMQRIDGGDRSLGVNAIHDTRAWNAEMLPLSDVARYPELVSTVARFSNPASPTKT
ncbi:MAG: KAP family NTPase [Erythrobacter sp.]|nr:KAP family NTPase [Erythrobacter sp.]